MSNNPIEQIWFQNEYVYFFGYTILFLLPAVLLLLGSIYKPEWPFYALPRKRYNLSENTYRSIYVVVLIIVVGGYVIGNLRLFDGIGILPNNKIAFYYFHPAKNKIVDFKEILSFRIIPDPNKDENIGYLEIQLKDGRWIRSTFLKNENKDEFNSAIQLLDKILSIKEQSK